MIVFTTVGRRIDPYCVEFIFVPLLLTVLRVYDREGKLEPSQRLEMAAVLRLLGGANVFLRRKYGRWQWAEPMVLHCCFSPQ